LGGADLWSAAIHRRFLSFTTGSGVAARLGVFKRKALRVS
jgi:hypothetical protein